MKKGLLLLLSVILVFGLIGASVAGAAGDPTLAVSTATANPGETATITINVENNPGISACELEVTYDDTKLELTKVEEGAFSGFDYGVVDGKHIITWFYMGSSDFTTNGIFATLTFTVKENATPGDAEVTVSYKDGAIYDRNEDNVDFAITPGKVTVNDTTVHVTGVTLDKTSLDMKPGDTATLKATVKPNNATNKEVTWSSSNEDVATVDQNGKVTAVAKGDATITATAADNKTATCAVKVTVPVDSVTLSPKTLTLMVGETGNLTAEVLPAEASDPTVTWSSSKTGVATVSDGTVTAKAVGETTITAKAGGKSDTCTVTVVEKKVPATSIELDKTSLTMKAGDSEKVTATLKPDDTTDKVEWTSSDTSKATVDQDGNITAVAVGTATITAKANDTVSATCAVTIEKGDQTITAENKTLTYGDTGVKIGATTNGDATLTYTPDNSGVITVAEDGTITAVKAGEAKVKINAPATDNFNAAEEKEITVTVNKKEITITANSKTAKVGDKKPELAATDYKVTGLVGEDKLTKEPTLAYASEPDMSKAGSVAIKASGAEAGDNYTIKYVDGKLTIEDKSSGDHGSSSTNAVTPAEADNGSVSVSPEKAKKGETVTVTPKPDEGYELEDLTVTDKNGKKIPVTKNSNGTYSFTMPDGPVTVTPTFRDANCPSKPYKDVDPSKWYHEAVDYAIANGLMNGVSSTAFAPDGTLSRAMLVTILYRLEGQPAAAGENPFDDVADGTWYTDAVIWANANGIVKGFGDGTFLPDANITREQMAAIIYRYAQFKGYDVSKTTDISGYNDASSVSDWALDAMKWANATGLITGRSAKTLAPEGNTTRAEAAAILMRFIENNK